MFYQPETRGFQCALLGSDTLKGVPTWKIEVNIPADTLTIVSWLRQNDGLEVQRVLYEKGEAPMKVFFSDFREVAGLMLPFLTETHNRSGITVYEYTEIKTNEPLPDRIFEMPDSPASDQKDAAPRKN
ncbi:MAG: outer membrane lipoprotein-sorting protein [Saprospiraceae bacterium]|nr:outer membrane lipoprotein-sorting protein [Saprospiraceae bacterium]